MSLTTENCASWNYVSHTRQSSVSSTNRPFQMVFSTLPKKFATSLSSKLLPKLFLQTWQELQFKALNSKLKKFGVLTDQSQCFLSKSWMLWLSVKIKKLSPRVVKRKRLKKELKRPKNPKRKRRKEDQTKKLSSWTKKFALTTELLICVYLQTRLSCVSNLQYAKCTENSFTRTISLKFTHPSY